MLGQSMKNADEANEPPCHLHKLHRNAWLAHATRVVEADAQPRFGFPAPQQPLNTHPSLTQKPPASTPTAM